MAYFKEFRFDEALALLQEVQTSAKLPPAARQAPALRPKPTPLDARPPPSPPRGGGRDQLGRAVFRVSF